MTCPSLAKNPFLRGAEEKLAFLVIAHRGARAYAPENTLAAFDKALRMGAQMIELDVHLSKDDVPVVVHDDTLERCSDVKKKFPKKKPFYVSDFTTAELAQLDAGSWFVKELNKAPKKRQAFLRSLTSQEKAQYIPEEDIAFYQSGLVKIPTLEQVLDFFQSHSGYLNIEIKQMPRYYQEIATKVVALVEKYHMAHRVIISSFDHYELVRVKQQNPHIATAALSKQRIFDPINYCLNMVHADAYHPCCIGEMDSLGFQSLFYEAKGELENNWLADSKKVALAINVWTENEERRMKALVKAGVTGIFTDYPNRLLLALEEKEEVAV